MAHPTVGKSTRGGSVLWVQRRLGVKPSGVYGTATVRAVKRLQAVAGLKQTGIVDAKTWSALGVPYRKPKASRTASLLKPGTVGFGNLVLAEARKYAGAPYRYGGMSPRGFDCSGLVSYVFGKLGVSLPHSSGAIKQRVTKISRSAVRPGDLVFVSKGGRTSHVAIYAGGGYWFEASNPSRPVGKNKAWSSSVSYGRVA
nr:NlpC/P60 family protein [Motilibacter aurantiacus]